MSKLSNIALRFWYTSKTYYHVGLHNNLNRSSWEPVSTNRFTGGDTVTVMSPGPCCYSILFHWPSSCQHWSTESTAAILTSCQLLTIYPPGCPMEYDGIDHPPGYGSWDTAQFLDPKKQQKSKHLSRDGHAQIGDVGRSVPHYCSIDGEISQWCQCEPSSTSMCKLQIMDYCIFRYYLSAFAGWPTKNINLSEPEPRSLGSGTQCWPQCRRSANTWHCFFETWVRDVHRDSWMVTTPWNSAWKDIKMSTPH